MRPKLLSISMLVGLLVLLAACGSAGLENDTSAGEQDGKNADGYMDITAEQLAEMLPEKDFTLVNVHIPYGGEIEQTDLFIPFDQIADQLDKLPGKDEQIILYCRSGSMSTTAAKELAKLGYTNVMELDGGFNAWKAAGYELLTK